MKRKPSSEPGNYETQENFLHIDTDEPLREQFIHIDSDADQDSENSDEQSNRDDVSE
jgi:hypothetical protein